MSTPALTHYDQNRGSRIVAAALAEHRRVVEEPPAGNGEAIREYLRAAAFTRANWYEANRDAEWCGAFAAFCLIAAGARAELLTQKSPPELGGLGSTYRALKLCELDPRRWIRRAEDVRAGDVVIVGRKGRAAWGEHIVVATGAAMGGVIPTVEGNAFGKLGNGQDGEGVVQRSRAVVPTSTTKGFIFGVRLIPDDYEVQP